MQAGVPNITELQQTLAKSPPLHGVPGPSQLRPDLVLLTVAVLVSTVDVPTRTGIGDYREHITVHACILF